MTRSPLLTTGTPRSALVVLGTATVYAAIAWFALKLALAPGYASPMYPSAGVALASALVFGLPGVLGAALGAFITNLAAAVARGAFDWVPVFTLPAIIAVGVALQAVVGAALVRRFVAMPLALAAPRDILRFCVWGGPVACLVSASICTTALGLAGVVSPGELLSTAGAWWAGDSLGVLIGAPIALTLIGCPRSDWAPRRLSVGLPMLVGTALLASAAALLSRWEEDRLQAVFEHEAARTGQSVEIRLHEGLHALQSLHAAFMQVPVPRAATLRSASAWWHQHAPDMQAFGYAERVPRDGLGAFEAAARAEGLPDYRVFDRADSAGLAAKDADVVAIRMVEPAAGNARALGVNTMSVPAAREAILRAKRTADPAATRAFKLTQSERGETGVVVYQALYRGEPESEAQRVAALRGMVFVTLRLDRAVDAALGAGAGNLRWCLLDPAAPAGARRVAGAPDCELAPTASYEHRSPVALAGQTWELRLTAQAQDLPGGQHSSVGLFSIVGLAASALLGMLLLTVTGRARRIEIAVDERTQALTQEVNDRRAAEAALRESEQRQRNILDHVPIGLMYLDTSGHILEVNPRLCQMLGRSAQTLGQLRAADLAHPDDRAKNRLLVGQLLAGELPVIVQQTRLLRADGSELQARATLSVLHGADGRPLRLVGVVEDITAHLQLEETERARDAAEASSHAKSEFVSRMSHELRTPLNAMLGFAQLLSMDRKPAMAAHQQAWAAQIQHAGWHLLEMINDTLDLARIESGMVELNMQPVQLGPAIGSSVALVGAAIDKHGVVLDETLDPRAIAVMGDATRLKQVLSNLLSNAIKYNRDGGRVTIESRLAAGDKHVEIEVRDTGLGMSATQVDSLFQPYNRLGREASTIEGTGIGLVISRRLAELMGGTLSATSTEGAGSAFTLRLPRATFTDSGSPIRAVLPDLPDYRRRLVHYIEDNETNIEVMRGILSQRPQVVLEVSLNGLDGLAAVKQRRPDLILLDMHLPDIGGLELLRHLKHDDAVAGIPVLVVSADATPLRIEEALTLGAAHYLTKPVDIAGFLQIIDQALSEIDTRWG